MLPDNASGETFGGDGRPGARSITPPTGAADPFRADGSRRSVGPLGGPSCTRQTGYRSVLYRCSWTSAEPLDSPRPPHGRNRNDPMRVGRGVVRLSSGTAVKRN